MNQRLAQKAHKLNRILFRFNLAGIQENAKEIGTREVRSNRKIIRRKEISFVRSRGGNSARKEIGKHTRLI